MMGVVFLQLSSESERMWRGEVEAFAQPAATGPHYSGARRRKLALAAAVVAGLSVPVCQTSARDGCRSIDR